MYDLARRALFRMDAEAAHHLVLSGLGLAGESIVVGRLLRRAYELLDPRLAVDAFGLSFANPLGVAAGLDKNAVAIRALGALGFGSVEVGSVTAIGQEGNPRPRLFRLPEDGALINRMGFNNEGAAAVAARVRRYREAGSTKALGRPPVVGVNVGKSRVVELADAPDDYRASLTSVWSVADYVVINVSSPNTPGLRDLQRAEPLAHVLDAVQAVRDASGEPDKPVLLKLSPDVDRAAVREVVAAAEEGGVAGLIASNTTVTRDGLTSGLASEGGGLSGRPLARLSLRLLEALREETALPLVAAGGVATAADALERIQAGADLLQVYTAFIYRGPALVREVLGGLLVAMERRGVTSVSALRGSDSPSAGV